MFRIPREEIASLAAHSCFLVSGRRSRERAVTLGASVHAVLSLPRHAGATNVSLEVFSENGAHIADISTTQEILTDSLSDCFMTEELRLPVGLWFYRYRVDTASGTLYGGYAGGSDGVNERVCLSADGNVRKFQMSVSDFAYGAPKERYGGIIYHIFVDRFNRGGNVKIRPDAVMLDDWYGGITEFPEYPGAPLKNNTFFGGTLWGITDKLDYISSLGVNTIYLSPVFESVSNHKYDTGNYMKVDEMFGGDGALATLIRKAGERGIGIILDGVFNHTGADSLYFNRYGHYGNGGAYNTKSSPYYPWYEFQHYPDRYTCWWGIEILPRINPDFPTCSDYFCGENGVIAKYAEMGIAGFRLDVADELSDGFIGRIKRRLNVINPAAVLYGEVWEDASNKIAYGKRKAYYHGRELDGVMNYPLRDGIISYFTGEGTEKLRYALTDVLYNAPKRIRDAQMNLLGTHDTERILTMLGGEPSDGYSNRELSVKRMTPAERKNGIRRLKMAYTLLCTVPGIPTVYYGDEAGVEGYKDPFNRLPFPWGHECGELLDHYRNTGSIRRASPVYAEGEFSLITLTRDALLFARYLDNSFYFTCVNNSPDEAVFLSSHRMTELYSGNVGRRIKISPYNAAIFVCDAKVFPTVRVIRG